MKKVKVQDEEGIGVCAHARAGSVGGFGEYGRLRSPLNHKHPTRLREKEKSTVFSELSSETHEESQPPSRFSSFVITGTTVTVIETVAGNMHAQKGIDSTLYTVEEACVL